ncbi:DUF159-domain-containing protein [Choiromyces venosus 120613-1]|uniref:DUF159-domain-containing protein n=1 Tax=Choiromyces venosus 120613-1 TaxID=1336337 RepID=A0A3N4K8Y2_9PEZI|nr:DUF159-domain-containing protein [Choiromyces venosus 120613-1]
MCGRYAVGNGPGHVRVVLQGNGLQVNQVPPPEEGNGDIRRLFNVAPGNYQLVYRAFPGNPGNAPEEVQGGVDAALSEPGVVYALEYMKWGLIPSWSTTPPNYPGMLKTINCRSDSLAENKPLWSMKNNKRCIVVALGFYEWLHKGKDKIPHFVKRKDGEMMLFAGLWDCVRYEGTRESLYTYTIITTEANEQLSFLHERMPVILESSEVKSWLSPKTKSWNPTLQSMLKPYSGALEVYPVSKDVGKVALDSPSFIVPVDSTENKSNIKNFFITPKKGLKPEATPKQGALKASDDEDLEITGSSPVQQQTSEISQPENSARKPATLKKPMKNFFTTPKKKTPSSSEKFKKEEKDTPGASLTPHIPFKAGSPSPLQSTLPTSSAEISAKRERSGEGGDAELARKLARMDRPEEEGDEELARKLEMEERLMSSPLGPRTRSSIANTPKNVKVVGMKKKATPAKGKGKDKGSQKITSFFGK